MGVDLALASALDVYKDSYQGMRYYDVSRPRYSFGDGLTYTRFAYELLSPPEWFLRDGGEDLLQGEFCIE